MTTRTTPPRPRHRPAFSLVELMISMALALILLLGVNYVFRSTQQTVSTGLALSSQVRLQSAAADAIRNDFLSAVSAAQQPVITIHSTSVVAFENQTDQQTDKDGLASTLDIDNDGIEGENAVPGEKAGNWPGVYTKRMHRVDTLSFFARDRFHRQTGQPAPGSEVLVSDMDSREAWIWYGHAALPDKAGTNYYGPAQPATTNPPEFIARPGDYTGAYATNWVLARMAMLLVSPDSSGYIYDNAGTPQVFYDAFSDSKGPKDLLWPLAYGALAVAKQKTVPSTYLLHTQESAFDLAGTDISAFREIVKKVSDQNSTDPLYPYSVNWWNGLVYSNVVTTPKPEYRFQVNPFPILNPAKVPSSSNLPLQIAKTTPALIKGCTQFIVEFAGDFVTQNNAGKVIDAVSASPYYPGDGIVDYYLPDTTKPNERRIRWYGAQRDIGSAPNSVYKGGPDGTIDPMYDIVPLSLAPDYSNFAGTYKYDKTNGGFEREVLGPPGSPYVYTCAWGPNDKIKPKMIRVTIETTDPQGRVQPRVEQYVMTLK